MIESEILENVRLSKDVYLLSISRTINFKPGQVIRLAIKNYEPRIYSIASGNKDPELRILYDINPEGQLTPLIKNLRKGDYITISEAFGNFTDQGIPAFWIANGTGIAPFYAMFRSGLGMGNTLIHGGRNKESFFFQNEWKHFFKDKYIRCCSRETEDGLYSGRLTQYLAEQKLLSAVQKYYLCGSAEMVVEARDILISKGIPFSNILSEIYF